MRHPARWAAGAVGVAVVVLAIVLATQVGTNPRQDATTSRLVGRPEPSFTVHTFDGRTLSSTTLTGRAVIVNFWNSWCIPCQQELPALRTFQQRHAGDPNVVLLGIVRDDTLDAARAYATAERMTWALANDADSSLSVAFGTRGQPETYAISPSGVVVGSQFGPTTPANLEQLLAAAQGAAVSRTTLSWLGVAVIAAGALAWAAWPHSGPPTAAQRAHELATELRCPDCEALSVADSSTSSARAIRADLLRRTEAGQSDGAIRRVYVDRYGESILLKPESSGLGVLVWALPVVALAIGAVGLAFGLARWRREPRLRATRADEALVDRARSR